MCSRQFFLAVGLLAATTIVGERAAGQSLTLVINPLTGQTSIRNVSGSNVDVDGYLLATQDGSFNLAGWTSLEGSVAGWRKGNPTTKHVSEVNLNSSLAIGAAGSLNLGALYTPFVATQIGQTAPAVDFQYHVSGGASVVGDVLFAPQSNLVLVVNPVNGAASIQNQSSFPVAIDGYTISSPTGVLASSGWTSFIDSGVVGWREANPGARHLSETNLDGSRMFPANSAPVAIGSPINLGLLTDQTDLAFDFHIDGGATVRGGVAFALPSAAAQPGDLDGNSRVDGADVLKFQRGLGPTYGPADLVTLKNNFGAGGATAASGAVVQAVPEPGALGLLLVGGVLAAASSRRSSV